MRFQQVISRVYGAPWMTTVDSWNAIHSIVMSHWDKLPGLSMPEAKRPSEDFFGEPMERMRIEGGVAVIPIKGALIKGASMFEKMCGAVAHDDIASDIRTALGNPRVKAIILDVNSPGGMVVGTPELAAQVRRASEKVSVFAFADELMASAAYYISAAAKIYVTPSANVGSIGVIWEFQNVADALRARGIEYDIFTSGWAKGMGHPAKHLSDEQRDWIQGQVNTLAGQFKSFVSSVRPGADSASMHGQVLTGDDAINANLADGYADNLDDVIKIAEK